MRHHLLVICAAGATLAAAIAVLPQAAARGAPATYAPSQSTPSPCIASHTKTASPAVLLLGETVDITLTVKALCPVEVFPLHVVLVLDGSATMRGQKNQQMRQTATRLIRAMSMPTHPWIKAGVVEFNTRARRLCRLTNDESRAVGCVNRVGADGGTRIHLGIREGLRVIARGRPGLNRDQLTEVLVVLSDGGNDAGCTPVLSAARQAKGEGVLVISVCVGNDCDEQCMRQVASGPRYYFRAENGAQLATLFESRRDPRYRVRVRQLTVYDALPAWMEYVPESADPPQSSPDDPDQWLKWEDVYVPADGVTYALKVKPLKTGYMPTNTEATGEWIDNRGRPGAWAFQQPWVMVLDPALLPTSEPTSTSTATATSRPSPTSIPAVQSLYLPRVLRHE